MESAFPDTSSRSSSPQYLAGLPDSALLHDFAISGSEAAFHVLVRRHAGLVLAVACRRLGGDAGLAEDAAQQTFIALARNPGRAAARLDLLSHPTSGRLRAAATILLNWTTCDPPAAAAWLDKLGARLSPRQLSAVALPTYFVEFQTGQPKLTFLEGSRLAFEAARHPAARRMFADDWLQAVAKEQPAQLADATAEVARQLTAANAGELIRQSTMAEINKDPAAWLAALPEEELGQLPPGFLSQAVTSWAARDTPAATRWALVRGLTDHAVSGVNRWYSMDPAAALHFVNALPPGETRDRGMVELCGRFSADQDFPTAEKCLAAIRDPKQAAAADVRLRGNRERHSGKR